jgi:uncharacterized membrane protein
VPCTRPACGAIGTGSNRVSSNLRARAGLMTWLSWSALLLQQALDAWEHQAPWFIWALKLLPLLMFLPGMLRDNLRSYIWLCFICLGYFLILVQRIFAEPESPLVIGGLAAVVVLFIAAMFYVRWRARELRSLAARPTDAGD